MPTPLSLEQNVGYIATEDIYIIFTEYYGGDTVYGRQNLVTESGEPVQGYGKTKVELIAGGVLVADEQLGTTVGWLTRVGETEIEPAVFPPVAPDPVPEVKPEPVPEAPSKPFTVRLGFADHIVTYENIKSLQVTDGTGAVVLNAL